MAGLDFVVLRLESSKALASVELQARQGTISYNTNVNIAGYSITMNYLGGLGYNLYSSDVPLKRVNGQLDGRCPRDGGFLICI